MHKKQISAYIKTLIIISISFLGVYTLSVLLYFDLPSIQYILLFLLVLANVGLLFLHDNLDIFKIYLISCFSYLMFFILIILTGKIFQLDINKWVLCTSINPIVFLIVYKIFNSIFNKIYKRKPTIDYKSNSFDKNYFYFLFLIYVPIFISFKLYDFVKPILF